jgi:hypothetical protein
MEIPAHISAEIDPRWVPGAHNYSTVECVSAEARGLQGVFGWDDGPWPANAEMESPTPNFGFPIARLD